jgi:hypothetical protein
MSATQLEPAVFSNRPLPSLQWQWHVACRELQPREGVVRQSHIEELLMPYVPSFILCEMTLQGQLLFKRWRFVAGSFYF